LRALGEGMIRWGWASARSLSLLGRTLASAGLKPAVGVAML
jgi:hypothetical protein